MSSIKGFVDYQRREYCKDIQCSVQMELETHQQGSEDYERVRNICKTNCKQTTYQFHHWLIDKGYLIVRPAS